MKRIERKQAAMSRMNVQSQPAFSATEPKIKTYVTAVAADKAVAQKMGQQLIDESAAWMA